MQYKLTFAGGLKDIPCTANIEYGSILIIESNFAAMSLDKPVDSHVENIHLIVQALIVGTHE